jgi:hypothetical protein
MINKKFFYSEVFLNLSCLVIFLLSIFLRSLIDIGADTGIYLSLAKKISQGGKYYYDFFESNFPLSFYFYYLQFEIAQIFHLSPIILSEIVINFLALGSIFCSAKILKKTTIIDNQAHYHLMIVSFFLSFFLRPYALQIGEFGTKTSLLLIALYPYLAFSFERKIALSRVELFWRGCLMGLIPCIKPHYLVLILFIELKCFFQKKSESHLDKFVMILIGSIYLFWMLKVTPEFFEFIVPMWPKIYAAYDQSDIFIQNIWRHFGARITVFAFIFLIFSRLKADQNDKILGLLFLGSSTLILLENIGTIDQITVFYAAATICFCKFIFDLVASQKIKLSNNKFVIGCLAFVPIFDLDMLPNIVFGVDGIINFWWVLALFYPFFLFKDSWKKSLFLTFSVFLMLILAAISAKLWGGFAYVTISLGSLFLTLFFIEKKSSQEFFPLSVFVICATISCLFYAYVASISEVYFGSRNTLPNKISDMVANYSKQYAPEKTDGILMISIWNYYQFPLINYLEKENYQKYHIASIESSSGFGGNYKMFKTDDLDRVFTLFYLFEDIKNQVKNPKVKVIFVNNSPKVLIKKDRCLIGSLEYYFLDPDFKRSFFKNFHFKNRVIDIRKIKKSKRAFLTKEKSKFDQIKPASEIIENDFEVYVRNEK